MKLIRHLEAKLSRKEFMEFVANTVYEERTLIEEKEDELFVLEKMIEYEENEIEGQEFDKRHHIKCYILTILSRICEADP